MDKTHTEKYDFKIINAVANFLNSNFENTVTEDVLSIMKSGVPDEYAVSLLIGEGGGMDTFGNDRADWNKYFPQVVKKQNPDVYLNDEYFKRVLFTGQKLGNAELRYQQYNAYEPFVLDDLSLSFDGVILPKIGFFDSDFRYPAVKENGRIWMTVTPNEINTMKEPISKANGKVLTLGLGLGYFAFSCAIKNNVSSITVIEKNPEIISLFENCILPFFPKDKHIEIINSDAIDFMKNPTVTDFDFVFCDLWHDVSDGISLWLKLKEFEKNFEKAEFRYWIEKSMQYYIK